MRILIVNDDGIFAPGIEILARHAAKFGDVTVVAPAAQCSAMSHKITLHNAMTLDEVAFPVGNVKAYRVGGTPADCVKAALDVILPEKPDYVFSGVNLGYNIGHDIVYSGTIGAAMEALQCGIPAAAFSRNDEGSWEMTEAHLSRILAYVLCHRPAHNEIWNINFPGCAPESYAGDAMGVSISQDQFYKGKLIAEKTPQGTTLRYPKFEEMDICTHCDHPGTDFHAVLNGQISLGKLQSTVLY